MAFLRRPVDKGGDVFPAGRVVAVAVGRVVAVAVGAPDWRLQRAAVVAGSQPTCEVCPCRQE